MNDNPLDLNLSKALVFHKMMNREGNLYMSDFELWLEEMGLLESLCIKEPGWEIK